MFRNFILQNFPFLEDDFDALTDYELFCKMMSYIKEVAKENEEIKKLLENLQPYVDNKLDEMAEDGTLADIINQEIFQELNTAIQNVHNETLKTNIFKDKKVMLIGDSLNQSNGWGNNFVTLSECDGLVYGNGSAGFVSKGITAPFIDMNFDEMLQEIALGMDETEKNELQYLIVGGGINDALNNYTPTAIYNGVNTFIADAKNYFPNAKIIIIPLHTFKWLVKIELERYTSIIKACKENGVETTDKFIFWTTDDRTYDSGDHVHLNNIGYQKLSGYMLSFINGTKEDDIEAINYTLNENWEIYKYFDIYKRGNIVYISGVLHYTGSNITDIVEILSFEKNIYLTGSNDYNKLIPASYYADGEIYISNVNVINGTLKTGTPINYDELTSPYLYINGSFIVGLQ